MSITQELHTRPMARAIGRALAAHWRVLLVQGVAMVVLGIAAFAAPTAASIAVELYLGSLFLISGVIGVVALASARELAAFTWGLLTAAMATVSGIVLLNQPIAGTLSLTLLLASLFAVEGVLQIVAAFHYKDVIPRSWLWMAFSGMLDLMLAALIWTLWPISAVWALGLFAGANLLSSGWAAIMAAIAGRSIERDPTPSVN